jgi:hypothetical protein
MFYQQLIDKLLNNFVENYDNLDLLIVVELAECINGQLNRQILKNQGRIQTYP